MRILFIIFCAMIFVSCNKSNQEKAENLIAALKGIDPNIKNIEFGTLEKAHLDYELTMPAYKLREEMRKNIEIAREKQEFINQWKDIYPAGLANDLKEVNERAKYVKVLNDSFELEKKRFHPDTTRYMMAVRFHYINPKTNNVEIVNGAFFFDKNISRVVGGIGPIDNNNGESVYIELERENELNIP